jgi:MOSC domain-containing protein YiiM
VQICHLYISAGHSFFGRHGKDAGSHPMIERDEVECLAGRGIAGDRFFDYKSNYSGQITFFAGEVYDALCRELNISDVPASGLRRNVITRGIDLNSLIGKEFDVQGVSFRGREECKPCYWMDRAFKPGAEAFLKGRGGLRAMVLTDGWLRRDLT